METNDKKIKVIGRGGEFYVDTYIREEGIFSSLREAVLDICQGDKWYQLGDLLRYNKPSRDILREFGWAYIRQYLLQEVPELSGYLDKLDYKLGFYKDKKIGEQDVIIYPIDTEFEVYGHHFQGLEDLKKNITASVYKRDFENFFRRGKPTVIFNNKPLGDLSILKVWDSYPTFDSSDGFDDRRYQNYLFVRGEITEEYMDRLVEVLKKGGDWSVDDSMPDILVPRIYYRGERDWMYLIN